jgi:hypothetical protein
MVMMLVWMTPFGIQTSIITAKRGRMRVRYSAAAHNE